MNPPRIGNPGVETQQFETHEVENQPPDFAPRDLWADDIVLREAMQREGAGEFAGRVATYGALAGSALYELSVDAHRDRPRLRSHDAQGHRIDRVEFHPNYHALMRAAIEHGVAGLGWRDPAPGGAFPRARDIKKAPPERGSSTLPAGHSTGVISDACAPFGPWVSS